MRQYNFGVMMGALALCTVASVAAVAATPAETIAKRQANFKSMGKAFKGISDELKKPAPDMAFIKTNAAALHKATGAAGGLFPKGTGPEAGVKTSAKPEIWAKWNDFKAVHIKSFNATNALEKAAKTGNLDAVKAAAGAVGPTCKGCHDPFRLKD